jgi:Spy/CpxP family protein refolding chaperone
MKSTTFPCLASIVITYCALGLNLKAQDAPDTSSTTQAPEQKHPRFIQQLGLTDAQKAQIKQIVQTEPKGQARRQAIIQVLTPEQKAQLKQDLQQWRAQHQQDQPPQQNQ